MRVVCARLSVCECASFPFDFEDEMWDLIVLVRDHCFPVYYDYYV